MRIAHAARVLFTTTVRIAIVPCLADNYAYLVVCERTGAAAVVDPSEAEPVLAAVAREGVDLVAAFATHHHFDHVGGIEALARARPGFEVVGHASGRGAIPALSRAVEEGDRVSVGDLAARVLHNPGHTLDAASYLFDDAVFTGDTLFAAGCGRVFEGTPEMMHASLAKLAALPGGTRGYPGHEYAAKNLAFALTLEPQNAALAARSRDVDATRARGEPARQSTIAEERATNPFLRCDARAITAAARRADPVCDGTPAAVFAAIRRLKDAF